ncbi:MAG: very short patch repair endonuclease [Planctomycetes bacterium]|nr:very short patch repair endonuclease [Planctomycetota bacterium]
MADTVSPRVRSETMRRVRGRGTWPEVNLQRALRATGSRNFRLNVRALPGCPDIVFPSARVALFVDGCFWHGCPRCYRRPNSRRGYWDAKLARNRARDRRNRAALRVAGWRVVRIWEHEVAADAERCAARIAALLIPKETTSPRRPGIRVGQ